MSQPWLDKLRGVKVQDNGVQLGATGRIEILNFLNANLSFNEATGVVTVDFDITSALPDMPTDRLLGRDSAGTGAVEHISVSGGLEFTTSLGIQRSALTGDVTASAGSNTTSIATNAVTNAKLRDSAALSVIGRSAASSGDPADIAAANDGEVLRRSGSTLGFGTIVTASIGDGQVTVAKIQNISTDRLLGRDTAGTGVIEEISVGGGLEFTDSLSVRRSALTGDVTASAGSSTTVIENNVVTNAKLRDSAALSVIGRSADSSGDPADIVASVEGTYLGYIGGILQFAAIDADDVTLSDLEDIVSDRILGRDTAGTGPVEVLTVGGGLEFTGSLGIQRSALTGDVTASAGSNATTIANNAVTDVKLRDSAANSVIGRAVGTSGDPADITAGTDTVLGRNGSNNLAFVQVQTGMIADLAVTNAKLRESVGVSVLGRAANSTGAPADIVAASDGLYLGRSGGVVQFIALAGGSITDGSIPTGKLADIASDRLLGRDSAGTGPVEVLTVSGGVEFTGSLGIQRSALTGDVTASAGSNSTTIANNAVTDAKLRDSAANSVIGRASGTLGDPADIVAGTDTVLGRDGSNVVAFVQVQTGMIAAQAVTFAKIQNIASDRLIGRDSASSGSPEEITVGGGIEFTTTLGIQRSALTGDVTASAGSNATVIANNAVTDAKLRDSVALSVIGRSANSTGDPADIAAANDGEVLRRSGTTIGFGTVATAGITNLAVTFAKMQEISSDRLLGRDTAGTGSIEQISVGGGIEFTGSLALQVSAFTGDVTKTAGGTALSITTNAVLNTHLRDSAGFSVIGKATTGTGDPADIVAGTDSVLGRNGSGNVAFAQIVTGQIANDAVTYAKLQNVSASSRIMGRITSGVGDMEELTGAQALSLLPAPGSTTQVLFNNAGAFGATSALTVSTAGTTVVVTQSAATSGATPVALTVTPAAHTGQATTGEALDFLVNGQRIVTRAAGAVPTQRSTVFVPPELAFASSSVVAVAATVAIAFAPVAGTNCTITNNLGLWLQQTAALGIGDTPARSAAVRLSGNTGISWRNIAGTPNTLDLSGIRYDALDNCVLGDNANATAVYIDCKTGGSINLRVGTETYVVSSTGVDFNNKSATDLSFISFGSSPATTGSVRLSNATGVWWRGAGALASTDLHGIGYAGDNVLTVGSTSAVEVDIASGGPIDFVGPSGINYRFGSSAADFTDNTIQWGTNPADGSTGFLRGPHSSTLWQGRNQTNSANATLAQWGVVNANELTFGDSSQVAGMRLRVNGGGTLTLETGGTAQLTVSSTTIDLHDNIVQFRTVASAPALGTVPSAGTALLYLNSEGGLCFIGGNGTFTELGAA